MSRTFTLFLIIFLEGYAVLSTELLAIRLLTPFAGTGTDTVSIIIAAVLMPLAFGYYAGGRFKTQRGGGRLRAFTVRRKLVFNVTVAAGILSVGLSSFLLSSAADSIYFQNIWKNRILLATIYSALFLVGPVYLLGQTVPLITNFFPKTRLSLTTGRILFFSTIGSFMGAVFCTLVLMTYAGVHHTVSITIGCLAALVLLLSGKKILSLQNMPVLLFFMLSLALNSDHVMKSMNIVANNRYNTVQIVDLPYDTRRLMKMDRSLSAGIFTDRHESSFNYTNYIEKIFIESIAQAEQPADILIVGAGGFTQGLNDTRNRYVYVDMDKDLKRIVENHFLEEELGPNKEYAPLEARAYLNSTDKKFDLIVLDIFRGPSLTPEHLVTYEFFRQIRAALKPGGIMVANYIVSPTFSDNFSIRIDNTLRAVFPHLNRHVINPYNGWAGDMPELRNVIYSAFNRPGAPDGIYTDDKNTSLFDKPVILP